MPSVTLKAPPLLSLAWLIVITVPAGTVSIKVKSNVVLDPKILAELVLFAADPAANIAPAALLEFWALAPLNPFL